MIETGEIKDGKTIVSISCSIHATEVVATQMSMLLAHELATAKDAETLEILNNTILILIPSMNPDGTDIVGDWYRKTLGTKSEGIKIRIVLFKISSVSGSFAVASSCARSIDICVATTSVACIEHEIETIVLPSFIKASRSASLLIKLGLASF